MIYSKGICWLDDTRIPFVDEVIKNTSHKGGKYVAFEGIKELGDVFYTENTKGRFTPNLLCCDDVLNDGSITKGGINTTDGYIRKSTIVGAEKASGFYRPDYYVNRNNINDKGSNSRYYDIDIWFNKLIYGL
jgi:hypothetical protein